MGRCFLDDDAAVPRHAAPADTVEDNNIAIRGGGAVDRGAAGARPVRLRDNPASRRSLTGYEFRRHRSR